jgi:N-acetyl-gamma-glutamyl-phosphate reductase
MTSVRVAVAGGSGYTGAELLRLLSQHPHVQLTAVTSEKSAGTAVSTVFPHLQGIVPLTFEALAPEALAERADVLFLALPHTKSMGPVATCMKARKRVVDLSADFRLKDPRTYETWYQTAHAHPDLIGSAVYGLPELHRSAIAQARLVASPGCYPTAAILQLAPLIAHDLIVPDTIVIDAKSGVSGAGRSAALPYHFPEAHESLEPYKIGQHRHIPEIEQELTGLAGTRGQARHGTDLRCHHCLHAAPGTDESRHPEHGLCAHEGQLLMWSNCGRSTGSSTKVNDLCDCSKARCRIPVMCEAPTIAISQSTPIHEPDG